MAQRDLGLRNTPVAAAKDYYKILGVARDATEKDIKGAYRRLARKLHPDVKPGDKAAEENFKDVSEAYQVLSDPEKRNKYDQFGSQWEAAARSGGGAGPPGGVNVRGGPGINFDVSGGSWDDFFGGIFGGARHGQARGPARGSDLQFELEVSLEEAYAGAERRLTITAPDNCPTCHGSGAEPGAKLETCPHCGGSGQGVKFGGLTIGNDACERCHGTGKVPSQPCHTCRGKGQVERPRAVTISITKGVEDGKKLRVAGQGSPGENGAPAGDLYLTVKLRPHRLFERKGDDLSVDLPVTFAEAALGAEVQVPTISGKSVTMTIPPGVQSGQQLRLSGQGMPHLTGGAGNMYARLKVVVPRNLTPEERGLIEQLQARRPENPRERLLSGR